MTGGALIRRNEVGVHFGSAIGGQACLERCAEGRVDGISGAEKGDLSVPEGPRGQGVDLLALVGSLNRVELAAGIVHVVGLFNRGTRVLLVARGRPERYAGGGR